MRSPMVRDLVCTFAPSSFIEEAIEEKALRYFGRILTEEMIDFTLFEEAELKPHYDFGHNWFYLYTKPGTGAPFAKVKVEVVIKVDTSGKLRITDIYFLEPELEM
jgi:hypothetical protein